VLAGKYEEFNEDEVWPIAERLQDFNCQLWAECRKRVATPREVLAEVYCGFEPYEIELALIHIRRLKTAERNLAS
jgi:hypothetical protein